jgi:membrane protein DedA with SNARE-associated domain
MELATIIALLQQYGYFILFPLACIEGPMLGFVAATLIPLGIFHPLPLFIMLVLADVLPDIGYYFLGRWGSKSPLAQGLIHKAGLNAERMEFVRKLWHNHTTKAMLLTKFSYGLSTPLLVIAGLVHLPFRRFVAWSITLAAGQYAVLMVLGYFFGGSLALVEGTFAKVQLVILAAAAVGVGYYFLTRYMRRTFSKEIHEQ